MGDKKALKTLSTGRLSKLAYHAQFGLGVCFYHEAEALGDKESLNRGKRWFERALVTACKHGLVVEKAIALDNLCFYHLVKRAYRPALKYVKRALQTLAEQPGFSRDKAVVYHNAASAHLQAGESDIAEGYFLESAFHYIMVGDFDGLFKLYATLFHSSGRLPRGEALTARTLYEAVFAIWGYAGPPSLIGQMLEVNRTFFQGSVAARRPTDAARAISDLGFIIRYFDSENRTALAIERIREFFQQFGLRGIHRWVLPWLSSDWWSVAERQVLARYVETQMVGTKW
jgi:tetratricopeptide (TPR) repeat protein